MTAMTKRMVEKMDGSLVWHEAAVGRCSCGCAYVYAVDDLTLVWTRGDWEAEDSFDERCTERHCRCHRSVGGTSSVSEPTGA